MYDPSVNRIVNNMRRELAPEMQLFFCFRAAHTHLINRLQRIGGNLYQTEKLKGEIVADELKEIHHGQLHRGTCYILQCLFFRETFSRSSSFSLLI